MFTLPRILTVFLMLFGMAALTAAKAAELPSSETLAGNVRLSDHIPFKALAKAQAIGRVAAANKLELAISLPLRNPEELQALLSRLYDPGDPQFGQYLSARMPSRSGLAPLRPTTKPSRRI